MIVADLKRMAFFIRSHGFHRSSQHLLRSVIERLKVLMRLSGHHGTALDQVLIIQKELKVSCFRRRVQANVRVTEGIKHSVSLLGIVRFTLMGLIHNHSLVLKVVNCTHVALHVWHHRSLCHLMKLRGVFVVPVRRWSFI